MPRTKIDIESQFTLKVLVVLSKDHLGNTRVVMNENGHAIQDNSYYPFGMAISNLSYDAGLHPENKFKYNGKHCAERSRSELQDDFGLEWYDYGARFYDPQLGRWLVLDVLANDEMQIDKTPYGYAWNSPTNLTDPDGNCPWCIGALVGAATDYALQVAVNFAEGKTGVDALTDVDGGSIMVSAGAGALSGGLSVLSKVKTGSKLIKLATSEVGEAVIDAASSVTNQIVKDGKVDLVDTAIDITVGKTVGKKVDELTEKVAKQSPKAKTLARQVDRAERVAGDNPRPSRKQKLEHAKKKSAEHIAKRTTATTVSSTGVASESYKQAKKAIIEDDKNSN